MIRRLIINLNNRLLRLRRVRVAPEQLLLLLPRCLHRDTCTQNVLRTLDECRRCGRCPLASLVGLRDRYGLVACVVGGGQQAVRHTRRPEVKAVVAVACERELLQGIFLAFPKPVLAVLNATPEGPCLNTTVDPAQVALAIDTLLTPPPAVR